MVAELLGIYDRKGRFAIKPNLKSARDFSSGLAWVQPLGESNRSKIELIDNKGKIRFANKSESSPFDFQCGLAVARDDSNHKFGYINREGDTAIPYKFAQAESFVDGIAKVALFENGHYTYFHIDTSGNTVSNDRKTVSSRFNAGGAVAKDSDGHLVFIPAGLNGDHIRYGNFSEGLAPVAWWSSKMTRCNGFVDRSMRIALTLAPEVEDVGEFHDGLAAVLVTQPGLDQLGRPLCHQIGFIDKTGKLVIPAKFEAERIGQGLDDVHFSDGIARVNFDGYSCCYINTKGELIGKFCQGGDFEDV